jgi:poly(3-hydroxybutyrate) depolymerase
VDRRAVLLGAVLLGAGALAAGACTPTTSGGTDVRTPTRAPGPARLSARPPSAALVAADPRPGLRALDVGPGREVLLHVPPGVADGPPPVLVLALHGAGGDARAGLAPLLPLADAHRLLLLSPSSERSTWDAVLGGWGPDVRRIDDALAAVFGSFPVDHERIGISGFSDGASYALSLGLANADLFTRIVAFSPGFVVPVLAAGDPRVLLSHGRADTVLPIDRTTRRIVPQLRAAGVPVEVREFDGPHTVPPGIAEEGARHLTA